MKTADQNAVINAARRCIVAAAQFHHAQAEAERTVNLARDAWNDAQRSASAIVRSAGMANGDHCVVRLSADRVAHIQVTNGSAYVTEEDFLEGGEV